MRGHTGELLACGLRIFRIASPSACACGIPYMRSLSSSAFWAALKDLQAEMSVLVEDFEGPCLVI